jgi:cytochrome c peroxidase
MLARAIAEFEFTLVFADAPIDKFARGLKNAMTEDEKRGAVLFFWIGQLRELSRGRRTVE